MDDKFGLVPNFSQSNIVTEPASHFFFSLLNFNTFQKIYFRMIVI